ncbi:hypothetical protein ACOMHN_065024 [Nucella lapillus]
MNQIVYFTFSGFIQILMYDQFGQQPPTLSATTLSLQLLELSGNGGVRRCVGSVTHCAMLNISRVSRNLVVVADANTS